jgi:hypothetical protein
MDSVSVRLTTQEFEALKEVSKPIQEAITPDIRMRLLRLRLISPAFGGLKLTHDGETRLARGG